MAKLTPLESARANWYEQLFKHYQQSPLLAAMFEENNPLPQSVAINEKTQPGHGEILMSPKLVEKLRKDKKKESR